MSGFRKMLCITLLVPVAACNQAVSSLDSAQTIRDIEAKWNQDYSVRDVDRLLDHYSDDAVLMAPGLPPSVGKKAIRKVLSRMVADPALSLKFSAARIDVAASVDLGYSQGSYLMTITSPQTKHVIHDYGSYVTMYRREADGTWRAVSDIATSEAVTPGAPAPSRNDLYVTE